MGKKLSDEEVAELFQGDVSDLEELDEDDDINIDNLNEILNQFPDNIEKLFPMQNNVLEEDKVNFENNLIMLNQRDMKQKLKRKIDFLTNKLGYHIKTLIHHRKETYLIHLLTFYLPMNVLSSILMMILFRIYVNKLIFILYRSQENALLHHQLRLKNLSEFKCTWVLLKCHLTECFGIIRPVFLQFLM